MERGKYFKADIGDGGRKLDGVWGIRGFGGFRGSRV